MQCCAGVGRSGPTPQQMLVVREVEALMKKGTPLQTVKSPQKGNQITASQMDGCHWGAPNAPCKSSCVAFVFRNQRARLSASFEQSQTLFEFHVSPVDCYSAVIT